MVPSDESVQVIAEPQAEIYLGDVAELTEGIGRSNSEAKRQPYN
ncbi:albusnodin family lasso peptide [Nocardiopsis alba]